MSAHEPPLHNFFEVIEMFPVPGFCPGGEVRAGYDLASFDCDTLTYPGHTLTTGEMTAATGLPWHDMTSLYPNWNCVPAVPGPVWVVDQCNPKADCAPDDCSEEAVSDPSASLGGGLDLSTGFLGQTPAPDLDLGHGLRFERHYASPRSGALPGPMGRAWEHSLQWGLRRTTAVLDSGSRPVVAVDAPFQTPAVFMRSPAGDSYVGSQSDNGSLAVETDGTARYTAPDGTVATFSAANQLVSLKPPGEPQITVSTVSNTTTFSNGQQSLAITTFASGAYAGRISTVTGGGQTWTYTYDSSQNLKTVTGPDPSSMSGSSTLTWTYNYTSLRMTSMSRSDRPTPLATWTWSTSPFTGMVATADEPALEQPLAFSYVKPDANHLQTTVSSGGSTLAVFSTTNRVITSVSNPSGPNNPVPGAVDPVPGGPGVPVPFVVGTADPQGRWKTKTDKNGNVTLQESYDAKGNPSRIVEGWVDADASGTFTTGDGFTRRREFLYHPTLGTPTRITEASALTGVFGDKVTTLDFDDPTDDPTPATPNSKPTTRLYKETLTGKTLDASGATVALTLTTEFAYNANGKITSVSGPRPENYTEFLYDGTTDYRTAVRSYLDGPSSAYLETIFSNFDALGNPQTVTDPNGRSTAFTYDKLSRVRTVTPPYPAGEQTGGATDPTISFTFDSDGNLTRIDFPPDTQSQPVFLRMGYDAKNRLTFLADSQQNAIVYDFTAGRATRESRHTGFVDLTNRGTRVGDAEFSYDSAGRLIQAFNPLFSDGSVFTEIGPDGNGNQVAITDENGREDALLYDALDRLEEIQQIRSATYTTAFGYDALSNVTSVTDAAGKATDLLHDDGGRLVKVDSPDTGTTLYLYDAARNLAQKIEDEGGASERFTSYEHDGLDRLLEIDLPNDPDWVFSYDISAALNQKGRLASVTDGIVTTELEYTQRGDVAIERTILDGLAYEVAYRFDAAGNRASIEGPSGSRVETRYSGLRPSQLDVIGGAASEEVQDITWYPFGSRTQAKFPPQDGSGDNTVVSTRTLNLRGQLEELDVAAVSGAILDRSYRYAYTAGAPGPDEPGPNLDQVIDHLDASESRFYFYDELDRLATAKNLSGTTLHVYGYDAVGNRTSKQDPLGTSAYSYQNGTDRLDTASGAEARDYAHDAYGNRIFEGTAVFGGTPSLVYDDANRLVVAKDPAAGFAALGNYAYDAFGRRVKKTAGGKTVLFFYDTEGHLVEEVEKVAGADDHARLYAFIEDELVGLVDREEEVGATQAPLGIWLPLDLAPGLVVLVLALAAGAGVILVTRKVPAGIATAGTGIGLLLVCASGSSGPFVSWVHTDPLWTPLAVTGTPALPADAETIWRARYEPFGLATVDEDPDGDSIDFALHVRFPGQYEDVETGWHYNLYRNYDPTTGRYIEADPLGVNAGINLYLYAAGRPTVAVDPTGLAELGVREFDSEPNRRFGLQPPLTWPPYAQHCFLRFNYDNSDTLSFDPGGVHADPYPEAGAFTPIGGPRDNDQCLRNQMQRCKPLDYDFFLFNCCNCASNAIYYCGLGLQGDWPNWPLDASEPPYWSSGPTPVELWLEMFMR